MRTEYLSTALDREQRREAVEFTVRRLRTFADQFDCIAFRGMSGSLVAPSVADALDKELIMVRKSQDGHSHSREPVEGVRSLTRYIILDDLISSGETVRAIVEAIKTAEMAVDPIPLLVVAYTRTYDLTEATYDGVQISADTRVPVIGTSSSHPWFKHQETECSSTSLPDTVVPTDSL